MKTTPNVDNATGVEEPSERQSTLTRGIINGGASAIQRTVKNCVEVTTQDSWERKVHQSVELVKEKITSWVTIWRIDAQNTKAGGLEGKFTLNIPTGIIGPGTNQIKGGTIKHNAAT
jgi:hypothetical protein